MKLKALTRCIDASNAEALLHIAETNLTVDLYRLAKQLKISQKAEMGS